MRHFRWLRQIPSPSTTPPLPAGRTSTALRRLSNWLNNAAIGTCGLSLTTAVVFNVSPGQTFNETVPAITATGTSTNTITFQKSGAGANPIIRPGGRNGLAATYDAGITITGGDYFTFDGIDINASNAPNVDYGYLVRNVSATDGAQNNTIRNTTINMNQAGVNAVFVPVHGIFQTTTSTGGGVTPTASTGANSTNRYYNFTISNTLGAGVNLLGTVGTGLQDTGCEIGTTTACGTNNTISGVGTTSTSANVAGILTFAQSGVKIFNNIIQGVSASTSGTMDGIYMNNTTSSTVSIGTCEIYNNKVLGVNNTNTGAGITGGIRVNLTTSASSSRVYNNWVTGLENAYTTAATLRVVGIRVQDGTSGAGSTHNIGFNNVRIAPSNLVINNACLVVSTTSGPIINVRNNVLANFTAPQTGSNKHYIVVSSSATAVGAAGSVWNYNDYYLANANAAATTGTPNGYIGLGNATDRVTLLDWQTATGMDANTITANPGYTSPTDLHVTATALNGAAAPTAPTDSPWVMADIDCETRPQPAATNYDIGADEIVNCSGTPTAGTITSSPSNSVCVGSSVTFTLTGFSPGGGISFQWRSSTTAGGPYTPIAGATNTSYTATNVATTTYYVVDVSCSAGPPSTTAQFTLTVNPFPTAGITPSSATACVGGAGVSLTASGGATYSWSPAATLSASTGATVTAESDDDYHLYGNGNECSGLYGNGYQRYNGAPTSECYCHGHPV